MDWISLIVVPAIKSLVENAALRKELGEAGWEKADQRQAVHLGNAWEKVLGLG